MTQKRKRGPIEIKTIAIGDGPQCDYDLLVDCRNLRNPYNVDRLSTMSGLDKEVQDFVMADPRAPKLVADIVRRAVFHPYEVSRFVIVIGCKGGRHRSVAIAEQVKKRLNELKVNCWTTHTTRWKWYRQEPKKPGHKIVP